MNNDEDATSGSPDNTEKAATTNDVAGFFAWANLEGSKYRDYSASRERSRADAHDRTKVAHTIQANVTSPGPSAIESKPEEVPSRISSGRSTRQRRLAAMPGGRGAALQRSQRPHNQNGSSRWIALNGAPPAREHRWTKKGEPQEMERPTLAFFSLAGGTGKTSLSAAVGALLAAEGISSLLVDTHVYGLLPLCFGARELSPGTSRTFASADSAPLRVLTMGTIDTSETSRHGNDQSLVAQIMNHVDGMDRILIDLSTASVQLLRDALPLSPTVLVVLAPNMASVVSLQAVQNAIEQMEEETGRDIDTFFLLNQFDVSLRLHRDVRERLSEQLGKRLLPFTVHHSNAVSEALATGTTVVDYAPGSQMVEDLCEMARWIREIDEPALDEIPGVRWRQR